MRREFLNGVSDDDDAVVEAFTHHNRESALKTKPKVCKNLFCLPTMSLLDRSHPGMRYNVLQLSQWNQLSFDGRSR